jgi:PAS domain S-box-containing protein
MTDWAVPEEQDFGLSAAALKAVVEQAPDGIFIADVQGRYTYVNAAGCRMLGYSRDDILNKSITDLLRAGDYERLMQSRGAMLLGEAHKGEWELRRADNTFLPVEVTANILPTGQWQGFVRDVSQLRAQQREQQALLERIDAERRRLQALTDTLPVGVLLVSAEGVVSANEKTEVLLGLRLMPGGHAAQYVNRIFSSDGRPVPPDQLLSARALRGETVVAEDHLIRRPDGSEVPILGSSAPVRGAHGNPAGAVVVFQDMSEHMRLQRTVANNERLLKAVFDLLPVGVWIADQSGCIVSTNPAGERIWCGARYVPVDKYGEYKGWWVDTGRRIEAREWALARALTWGETASGELVRIQCFDGSFKTIINSAAPIRSHDGSIAGAIVVNEDITALYEAQQKQRASEQLFRTVFDLLPVGLWIADKDGRIASVNAAGDQIWRGTRHVPAEQFGEYKAWWADSGAPIAPDEWGVLRAIRQGVTSRRELIRIQCFDGSFKTVLNWAAPIRSETGDITGAVAVNEDVTALHHTQEQLRAAVRDREHILAVVTHDLRNPLSVVSLAAATIEQQIGKIPGAEVVNETVNTLTEVTRQMAGLVSDLLAVAAGTGGGAVLRLAAVHGSALLEKAANAARPMFARAGLALEVKVEGELPILHVEVDRILRVFANLLDNALKFTLSPGQVVIGAQAQSGGVRYCIANTGVPLPPTEMASMFRPFWQAAGGDMRGQGLGLSICRSMVEAHGGTIWAEPAAGQRVRICFFLPTAYTAAVGAHLGTER